MIYFDTAYIVKCYIHEPGSKAVRDLLSKRQRAACCVIGRLEFAVAVKRAVREERLDAWVTNTVFSVLNHDDPNAVWSWLPLTPHLMQIAAQLVARLPDNVFIRSVDALHLACARENGSQEFYSNDRHVLRTAPYFDVNAFDVIQ